MAEPVGIDLAPAPSLPLSVSLCSWPQGQAIHRIHLDRYGPAQFNPGVAGNARFSPIMDAAGLPIPTLYGGSSFDCAAMETVFHDVPFAPSLKTFNKQKLDRQMHSVLRPTTDLQLVDLSHIALRKLGISRAQLIDTEKSSYPQTRLWAQAIHTQCPSVHGLCWVSRQDDTARAVMLFGNRLPKTDLKAQGHSRGLTDTDGADSAYAQLLAMAERIGLLIVTP
jgi:hypothetical protein